MFITTHCKQQLISRLIISENEIFQACNIARDFITSEKKRGSIKSAIVVKKLTKPIVANDHLSKGDFIVILVNPVRGSIITVMLQYGYQIKNKQAGCNYYAIYSE